MASRSSARILLTVSCVIGAMAGAVHPAAGSPPEPSNGCGAQPRLPARDYTHADWPIRQRATNRQIIGRTFNVHVPKHHEQQQGPPLAVVINLHGSGGTGAGQDEISRMKELADSNGFVVVTPDTWPWKDWTTSASLPKSRYGISDINFIQRLLKVLIDRVCVDRNRIYATGHSNGGIMSATLGRTGAEGKLGTHRIAAIAPVAAMPVPPDWELPLSVSTTQSAGEQPFSVYVPPSPDAIENLGKSPIPRKGGKQREPVPMHVFYGNQDRLVANGACYGSYSSQVSKLDPVKRFIVRSFLCSCYGPIAHVFCPSGPGIQGNFDSLVRFAQFLVNAWAVENGCEANRGGPVATGHSGWGVPIATVTYNCAAVANSRGDTILTIYDTAERPEHINNTEIPGGHIWPGAKGQGDFNLTKEIWSFFEKHPL